MAESSKKKARPEALRTRERHATKAEGWISIYVNSTEIRSSPWDFDFRFGRVDEATPEGLNITELVRMHMSPTHAKAVLALLALHVEVWERKHGTIPDVDIGLAESRQRLLKAEDPPKTKPH